MNHASHCPRCGCHWQYWMSSGAGPFSRIQSIYDRDADRTVGYRCPACLKEWDRDDPEIWENA